MKKFNVEIYVGNGLKTTLDSLFKDCVILQTILENDEELSNNDIEDLLNKYNKIKLHEKWHEKLYFPTGTILFEAVDSCGNYKYLKLEEI